MIIPQNVYDLLKPMPPFVPELRQANRSGKKTQTRRVMDPQPPKGWAVDTLADGWAFYKRRGDDVWEDLGKFLSPYGKANQVRYMREPLIRDGGYARYKDDGEKVKSLLTGEVIEWRWKKDVLSGMFMPKEAARTFKLYEFIRAEKLKDISYVDALAEGTNGPSTFMLLWNEINADRGYPWSGNWWVWVIGYKPFDLARDITMIQPPVGEIRGRHADFIIMDELHEEVQ